MVLLYRMSVSHEMVMMQIYGETPVILCRPCTLEFEVVARQVADVQ